MRYIDPLRSQRSQYTNEMLKIVRNYRSHVLEVMRNKLRTPDNKLDYEDIGKALDRLNEVMVRRATDPLKRFTRVGYLRGIDQTIQHLQTEGLAQVNVFFSKPDEVAIEKLAETAGQYLPDMAKDTKDKIIRIVQAGDKEGLGISRIGKNVYEGINALTIPRAEALATTSLNQAYNYSAFERVRQMAPYKIWIATHDDRTRDSHNKMDGVVIETEERFHVPAFKPSKGGREVPACDLMFPGDVSNDPPLGQIINCRCIVSGKMRKS